MRYDEFLAKVRELGEYSDREEAGKVAAAVLGVLAARLTVEEVEDLAAQLPAPLDRELRSSVQAQAGSFGVEEFCRRVAEATGARPTTAEWDAGAVLSTLAQSVSGGKLNQLLSQLPSGYAPLFGKPELSE